MSIAEKALAVRYEEANKGDLSFVYSSWLRSYRASREGQQITHDQRYYAMQHCLVEHLIGRGTVLVARPGDWDEGIVGWVCGEPTTEARIVHYVYVKKPYRKHGLARALTDRLSEQFGDRHEYTIFTHRAEPFTSAVKRWGWHFDPGYLGVLK